MQTSNNTRSKTASDAYGRMPFFPKADEGEVRGDGRRLAKHRHAERQEPPPLSTLLRLLVQTVCIYVWMHADARAHKGKTELAQWHSSSVKAAVGTRRRDCTDVASLRSEEHSAEERHFEDCRLESFPVGFTCDHEPTGTTRRHTLREGDFSPYTQGKLTMTRNRAVKFLSEKGALLWKKLDEPPEFLLTIQSSDLRVVILLLHLSREGRFSD